MGQATASDFRGAMRALESTVSTVSTSYTVGLADGVDWIIPVTG